METVKYNIGDIVYLKVKTDEAGMICGILFRPESVHYFIGWGNGNETIHYEIELTSERNYAAELS